MHPPPSLDPRTLNYLSRIINTPIPQNDNVTYRSIDCGFTEPHNAWTIDLLKPQRKRRPATTRQALVTIVANRHRLPVTLCHPALKTACHAGRLRRIHIPHTATGTQYVSRIQATLTFSPAIEHPESTKFIHKFFMPWALHPCGLIATRGNAPDLETLARAIATAEAEYKPPNQFSFTQWPPEATPHHRSLAARMLHDLDALPAGIRPLQVHRATIDHAFAT